MFEAIARVVVPGAEVMLITVTALYRVYLIVRPFAIIPEITSYKKVHTTCPIVTLSSSVLAIAS